MIEQGVMIEKLSERRGHSGYAITHKTYVHLYPEDGAAEAAALDAMYSAAPERSYVVSITR